MEGRIVQNNVCEEFAIENWLVVFPIHRGSASGGESPFAICAKSMYPSDGRTNGTGMRGAPLLLM